MLELENPWVQAFSCGFRPSLGFRVSCFPEPALVAMAFLTGVDLEGRLQAVKTGNM